MSLAWKALLIRNASGVKAGPDSMASRGQPAVDEDTNVRRRSKIFRVKGAYLLLVDQDGSA